MGITRLFSQQIKDRINIPKSRRSLLILILVGTFVFYVLSRWTTNRQAYITTEFNPCLQANLDEFLKEAENMDVIINHQPLHYDEKLMFPFTGNGYIGLSFSTQSDIHMINETDGTFVNIEYSPTVQIHSSRWKEASATILNMRKAFIQRIKCFKINERYSAHVTQRLYAHRQQPSLIVQDISIVNPSDQTIEFEMQKRKLRVRGNARQLTEEEISIGQQKEIFSIVTYRLALKQHQSVLFVVVEKKNLLNDPIPPTSSSQQTILTVTKFSPRLTDSQFDNETLLNYWQNELVREAKTTINEIVSLSSNKLFLIHTNIWSTIWQSGFSISRSLAPSIINGDAINRTLYYILSSTAAHFYSSKMDDMKKNQMTANLFNIDRCYESHSTLLGERLWRVPGDDLAVSQLTNLWRVTLDKKGCKKLINNGIDGILQAILLSIGGIRFRNHHLEMFLDPKELHRDMIFRSIHFGKQYHLNISIIVEHDNRAAINVSIDNENGQAYACDAGCIDPPRQLKTIPTRFPVKMTDPPTAILYITEDLQYMTELQDTLHVKEVVIAPPHAYDVLALHRHGHKLGGLPVIFWIALAFLILVFHLFLLKIVLNEMGFFKQPFPMYTYNTRARAH